MSAHVSIDDGNFSYFTFIWIISELFSDEAVVGQLDSDVSCINVTCPPFNTTCVNSTFCGNDTAKGYYKYIWLNTRCLDWQVKWQHNIFGSFKYLACALYVYAHTISTPCLVRVVFISPHLSWDWQKSRPSLRTGRWCLGNRAQFDATKAITYPYLLISSKFQHLLCFLACARMQLNLINFLLKHVCATAHDAKQYLPTITCPKIISDNIDCSDLFPLPRSDCGTAYSAGNLTANYTSTWNATCSLQCNYDAPPRPFESWIFLPCSCFTAIFGHSFFNPCAIHGQ